MLAPLARWYEAARQPSPPAEIISGEAMPLPYRQLLVHERDMTSTLETFHDGKIHLRVLGARHRGSNYQREVVLQLDGSDQPVEFGATQIDLETLPAEAQALILEGRLPFGGILRRCAIAYTSQPKAYFRITADAIMREAFRITGEHTLYGRRNTISDRSGRVIAEIVEILPPASSVTKSQRREVRTGANHAAAGSTPLSSRRHPARP